MRPELELAAQYGSDYVESLEEGRHDDDPLLPIVRETHPTRVRDLVVKELPQTGLSEEQVIEELHRDVSPGIVNTGSGRFFGFVIGGTLPVTIAAEWLVSSWDQNAGAYFVSPSAAVVEEVAGAWLKELLRLPCEASFAFVPGCQSAHFTALAAARHALLLERHGWNVEEQGMFGAPPIRVLVGEHHETLVRALRFLGFGTKSIVQVDTLDNGTLNVASLEKELDKDPAAPTIVAVAAGELNQGLFDPFEAVCDLAHERGAWVHVDGAFGLWANTSPRYRHLLKGVDKADSWATDCHKWLNVPQDCGFVVCRHFQAHMASMSIHAPYALETTTTEGAAAVRNQYNWGPEWSRRARGIAVYAALRHLGRQGVTDLVEQCCDLAFDLVQRLGELDGVQVMAKPIINQGLVRFLDKNGDDHDARTDQVINRINEAGKVWFGGTTWNGVRVMRISVCSHRTTKDDIITAEEAVKEALET